MHVVRQIVRDRIEFSAISALFAIVLLLQGLSAGFAQGGMAAAEDEPKRCGASNACGVSRALREEAGAVCAGLFGIRSSG
jgi:hypothetical protein